MPPRFSWVGKGGAALRLLEVVPTLEQEASGPSYCVPKLSEALAAAGDAVHLLSVGGQASGIATSCEQTRVKRDFEHTPVIRSLWLSAELLSNLRTLASEADIIHSHGMWVMPNVYPAMVARQAGVPLIMSPHGTFGSAALSYSRGRKRLFWTLAQRHAVMAAGCLHATSSAEYQEIRAFGLRHPITVIPNGIDVPARMPPKPVARAARTLLYLGRLHPKKGLDILLAAWERVMDDFPDWSLDIVGPGNPKYVDDLQTMARRKRLRGVRFPGALYGPEKAAAYRAADLFVLPTRNENFGMTVAESLALGTPVICTKGAPWRGLADHHCGWWVDQGVAPLAAALRDALTCTGDELAAMGQSGRAWMQRDFSWDVIAQQMHATYEWMMQGGRAPETVELG